MKMSSVSILSRLRSGSAASVAQSSLPGGVDRFDLHPDCSIDDCMRSLYIDPEELSRRSTQPSIKRSITRRSGSVVVDPIEASTTHSLDELDPLYFEESMTDGSSPVFAVVSNACCWDKNDSSHLFMERIEHMDSLKDTVMSRLGHMIQANKDELMKCFRDVQAVDNNLENTIQRVSLSRLKLTAAMELFDSSSMQVLRLEWTRVSLQRLVTAVKQISEAREDNRAMKSHMANGDLASAAECGYRVVQMLSSSDQKIESLRSISDSSIAALASLLKRSDEKLTRVCSRSFSAKEYEDVVRSFALLDEMHEKGLLPSLSDGLLDKLHEGVFAAISDDIRNTLHTSCLEAIYLDLERTGKSPESEELFRISGATFEDKCAAVPPDMAAVCVLRSLQQMVELLHTYSKITTWHAEQNIEWTNAGGNTAVMRSTLVAAAGKRVIAMQSDVWESVAEGLLQLLELVPVTACVDIEHLQLLMAAIHYLIWIGKLVGAAEEEKDQALVDCVEGIPLKFSGSLQTQSLQSLRCHLDSEDWQPLAIQFSDEPVLDRVLKLKPSKMNPDSLTLIGASDAIEASKGFPESWLQFEREGSPLRFSFESASSEDSFFTRLLVSNLGPSSYVTSKSTLAGLARLVGVLLLVSDSIASIQDIAIDSLTSVFDLYLSHVTTEFTSVSERSRYFGKPTKHTSPAPAMAQEFDSLRKTLARAAIDEYRPPSQTYTLRQRIVAAESCSFCSQVSTSSSTFMCCGSFALARV